MIEKPGKPAKNLESYRTISLLTIPFKVFEKVITHQVSIRNENSEEKSPARLPAWVSRKTLDSRTNTLCGSDHPSSARGKAIHTYGIPRCGSSIR